MKEAAEVTDPQWVPEGSQKPPVTPDRSRSPSASGERPRETMENDVVSVAQGTEKKRRWPGARVPSELPSMTRGLSMRWRSDEHKKAKQDKDARIKQEKDEENQRSKKLKKLEGGVKDTIKEWLSNPGQGALNIAPNDEGDEDKNQTESSASLDRRIVSPNPIVLNSSGIKGVFDIQRIVVKMLDSDSLYQKINSAISDKENIDGWCTISTGLALTMVAFSCERHILAQQLDLVDVVEKTVLKDPHDSIDRVSEQPQESEERQNAPGARTEHAASSREDIPEEVPKLKRQSTEGSGLTTGDEIVTMQYGNSQEQRRLSRMLDFVTESNLQAVAGEWVLARFSDAPGAKWFLCRLELGTGAEFYARRIPTDEINFTDAFPERGLVEYWHAFLRVQKSIMCDVLLFYLDSKKAKTYADWLGGSIVQSLSEEGPKDRNKTSDHDEENEDLGDLRLQDYNHLSNVRKMVKMIGWSTRGMLSDVWANGLNRHLSDNALKKIPVHLRAAVEALNKKQVLLPAMFHTGKEVHFF
ncbi:hypothetical protein BDV26DRAFT_280371 [Aspergillus bertholletiae]|uniref:Uncharacterized protein n=1 Tax=Aspergillus bertholletiae TaxID=1226010 RepID=A0A5N7BC77_9EURO|nr:hypothetical protein BDV26DRAFT_280371 [Aspergillus bertholletiae]